jgi:L-ascorbate metabolism protein UlaG (beta-lactamase superfamily)
MIDQIIWLGHGSFLVKAEQYIYINPWKVGSGYPTADVILVGHHHYEHFSEPDIDRLRGPDTLILTNALVQEQLMEATILRPWHSQTVGRISIKALPAYSPQSLQHPLSDGGLGFVISVNYYDIYYAGDTQRIGEMAGLAPDIAILPIDGNGTLTPGEAAEVVRVMRPRWVIPCNWGKPLGGASAVDVAQFREEVGDTAEVIVPEEPAAGEG